MGKSILGQSCCGTSCEPRSVNTFCGRLPFPHDETACHSKSTQNRRALAEMKNLLKTLECYPPCPQWDTKRTLNNTPGPFRFGVYEPRKKPWSLCKVKSVELIGSHLIRQCGCLQRNGLQDDCQRYQCRGRSWCRTEPFPICPPFTSIPQETVDPDPYSICSRRPWENNPDYRGPTWTGPVPGERSSTPRHSMDPSCHDDQKSNDCKGSSCIVKCPGQSAKADYIIRPIAKDALPPEFSKVQAPVFCMKRV